MCRCIFVIAHPSTFACMCVNKNHVHPGNTGPTCRASAPTGCTTTCGNAGVRTTTRTCISSAGQAVNAYLCGNCVTSSTPCPAIPACTHASMCLQVCWCARVPHANDHAQLLVPMCCHVRTCNHTNKMQICMFAGTNAGM